MNEKNCELSKLVNHFNLKLINKDIDYSNVVVNTRYVNRPGIQITGFLDLFDNDRIQIMGYVETAYLEQMDTQKKHEIYKKLLNQGAPCYIFCRNLIPDKEFIKIASSKNIPIFTTPQVTSDFMSLVIQWLGEKLAPSITLHGCLVDINGVGVFIRGESGIGKSEAVLELIKRGHRMVADDAVEICKASEKTLFGRAPEVVKDYLEIRGIGIVDIKNMFGVQALKETQTIELVVTFKEWKTGDVYDRIGDQISYIELLGNKVINFDIPVRPGRNLAVILEAAALNCRTRQMGYNDSQKFLDRACVINSKE